MKTVLRFALTALLSCTPMVSNGAFAAGPTAPETSAFILTEYDIKDAEAFKRLTGKVRASVKEFQGEFVLRDKVDSLFGGTPSNLSVISFPSVSIARAWLTSPSFLALKAKREKAATFRSYLVETLD